MRTKEKIQALSDPKKAVHLLMATAMVTGLIFVTAPNGMAASTISLGKADGFALLSGTGIANTGKSSVQGDLGIFPTISYTDAGSLVLNGGYHFGDAVATTAQTDLTNAYTAAVNASPVTAASADIGGQTLVSGVYSIPSGLGVTGTLTLDAKGNPGAIFIFQTAGNLSTAASSQINLVNGGQACNVYWQVGSTTSLGASSSFKGSILSNSNFVGGAGATVLGRILSLHGSIALNANTVTKPSCVASSTLYVTPENKTVNVGDASAKFSVKYLRVKGDLSTAISHPEESSGFVAPTCNTNPVYSNKTIAGTYVITCSGGNGGTKYFLDTTSTGSLVVKAAVVTPPKTQTNVSANGKYKSPIGSASFQLSIKSGLSIFDTSTAVSGQVKWQVNRQWKFEGPITSYSVVSGLGTATGSGDLFYWSIPGNSKGKWIAATNGKALVTAKFTLSSIDHEKPIASFAIGFTGTLLPGVPALPAVGPLVVVGHDD